MSTVLWWMIAYLLSGSVLSSHGWSLHEQISITPFNCSLYINDTNFTMECQSEDYKRKTSFEFFVVKLSGQLDLASPLSFKKIINSTSFRSFHSCESLWRYFLKIDPSTLILHCKDREKYLEQTGIFLNASNIKSLKVSQTSKPDTILNILSECLSVENIAIFQNYMPNLSSLPVPINNSVVSINLKDNKIENITDSVFVLFTKLLFLDLSHNQLNHVRKRLFEGIGNLKELDMSYNLIETIEIGTFGNLVSLRSVYFTNNNLKLFSLRELFRPNNFLSVIDLSNNDWSFEWVSNPLLYDLSNLKNFTCSNCSLSTLNYFAYIFTNAQGLTWMDFSYNLLQSLPSNLFKSLKYLEVVDLSYNKISHLNINLFPNHPYLVYLNLSNNEIASLKREMFTGAPNIRKLDLSKNKLIISLSDDLIKDLTDLEYFGLHHNRIETVQLGAENLVKIRILYLSDNNIKKLEVNWKQLIYIEVLNMDNNQLTSIDLPPCIPSVKQTLTFSFRYNKITSVNIDALLLDEEMVKRDKTMSGCFFNGLAKNFVDLTHNPLFCDCKLYPFYDYVRKKSPRRYQLEMFMYKENLTCTNPPFLSNRSLVSLSDDEMSCTLFKKCPESCRCGLRGKDDLIFVNCSSGNLTEVPQIIPDSTTVLYANRNKMSSMDSLNTPTWKNLRELHLDYNMLTSLNKWIIPSSLRYLSVRGNMLKTLPHSLMQFISNLTEFKLFFGYNDQNCDCDRKRMKTFMLKNVQLVKDSNDILCVVTDNGTSELLPLKSIPDANLCPETRVKGNSYQKKLIISLCLCFSLFIFLVLVYYRQRQLFLSFFYIYCDDLFRLFRSEENDDEKLFDAFVAYSSNDRETVLNLLQELEDKPPFFRLCIHERNWLPGHFITDNIVNSVESSRRTIVVLSNAFISSPWFNLELRAAVFKMSKNKMNRIIVILAEKSVSFDNLDPEIRHVISKRTYLVWGERWFWEKLRYAMPRKRGQIRKTQSRESLREETLVSEII